MNLTYTNESGDNIILLTAQAFQNIGGIGGVENSVTTYQVMQLRFKNIMKS